MIHTNGRSGKLAAALLFGSGLISGCSSTTQPAPAVPALPKVPISRADLLTPQERVQLFLTALKGQREISYPPLDPASGIITLYGPSKNDPSYLFTVANPGVTEKTTPNDLHKLKCSYSYSNVGILTMEFHETKSVEITNSGDRELIQLAEEVKKGLAPIAR